MVQITNEMKDVRAAKLAEIEKRIDREIERAAESGYDHCCFMIYAGINGEGGSESEYYDEIRLRYERAGYKVRPTGYIDGVYQRTERLYW